MNYHHDKGYNFSKPKSSGWKKPTAIVVIVLAVYLWGSSILVDASAFVIYPLLRVFGQVDQGFFDSLKSKKSLLAENKQLKINNGSLTAENLRLNSLQKENDFLRGLKEGNKSSPELVLGRILVKPNHLPYDEIIVDIGRQQIPELASGQLVFADREVVLGQVESIAGHFTKVKLYSSGGVKIPVVVGETAIPSIAEGLGSGNFSLELPRGVSIKVGDKVKTSIVGDYTLGYVANIFKDPNDPFQQVIFRSPYNIFELAWVQLLKVD